MLAFGGNRQAFPDNGGRGKPKNYRECLIVHGMCKVCLMVVLKISFPYREFLFYKVLHICVPHRL